MLRCNQCVPLASINSLVGSKHSRLNHSSFRIFFHHVFPLQMHFSSAEAFLLVLALSSAVEAGRCPTACSCDRKLTVTCVGKNITEIPPTIDEVRKSDTLLLPPHVLEGETQSTVLSLSDTHFLSHVRYLCICLGRILFDPPRR